jgi:hypothetical protein
MRILRFVGAAMIVAACTSTRIPESGDPMVAMSTAERAINEAQGAGADTLASGILAEARTALESARGIANRDRNRATLLARRAAADAAYAQAVAERTVAERARSAAQAELQQVPPQGDDR